MTEKASFRDRPFSFWVCLACLAFCFLDTAQRAPDTELLRASGEGFLPFQEGEAVDFGGTQGPWDFNFGAAAMAGVCAACAGVCAFAKGGEGASAARGFAAGCAVAGTVTILEARLFPSRFSVGSGLPVSLALIAGVSPEALLIAFQSCLAGAVFGALASGRPSLRSGARSFLCNAALAGTCVMGFTWLESLEDSGFDFVFSLFGRLDGLSGGALGTLFFFPVYAVLLFLPLSFPVARALREDGAQRPGLSAVLLLAAGFAVSGAASFIFYFLTLGVIEGVFG